MSSISVRNMRRLINNTPNCNKITNSYCPTSLITLTPQQWDPVRIIWRRAFKQILCRSRIMERKATWPHWDCRKYQSASNLMIRSLRLSRMNRICRCTSYRNRQWRDIWWSGWICKFRAGQQRRNWQCSWPCCRQWGCASKTQH